MMQKLRMSKKRKKKSEKIKVFAEPEEVKKGIGQQD